MPGFARSEKLVILAGLPTGTAISSVFVANRSGTPEARPEIASAWQVRASFSNAASVYYQTLGQFDVVDWLNTGRIGAG